MTDVAISITEKSLLDALGVFISSVVSCEVIRLQKNRVSPPKGDFVGITALGTEELSTSVETNFATNRTIKSPTRFSVQIDCYGALAGDRAKALSILLRNDYACQAFAATGLDIQPLYATPASQMPLITGEQQYLERWTFEAALQFNGVVTVAQDTANTLAVGLINVGAAYKP
jgi:hypothetical protein